MINKIIRAKDLNDLNQMIANENKNGWVVKQIFVYGDGTWLTKVSGIYALLEKQGAWK